MLLNSQEVTRSQFGLPGFQTSQQLDIATFATIPNPNRKF